MRNLKRVLSLALASAMLLGMMVIGAGAADKKASDLTDIDKVANKEAVNLMVDLGIIVGKPDGSYAPAEIVDRATMSKLIYVILTGSDDASAFKGTSNTLADVKGTWAEGFINYCNSMGIVTGDGTNFYPANKVTVAQAAKMLLVALGYDAEISKYVNDSMWSVNIMRDAQKAGLVDGISQNSTDELTRDNAARMIFNTLFAKTVTPKYSYDMGVKYLDEYTPAATTLGQDQYKLAKIEATVDGINSDGTASTTNEDPIAQRGLINGKLAATPSMVGAKVIAYYKNATPTTLYSTSFSTGSSVILGTSYDATTITKLTTKGDTKYIAGIDSPVTYFINGESKTRAQADTANVKGSVVELVDNDNDSLADVIRITKKSVVTLAAAPVLGKNSAGDEVVTISSIPGLAKIETSKVSGYTDLAKDDVVLYVKMGDNYYVEKAATISGVVSGVHNTKGLLIDGTYYLGTTLTVDPTTAWTDYTNTYTFYLDNGKNIVKAVKETDSASANYAVITDVAWVSGSGVEGTNYVEAKLLFTDGTTKVAKVASIDGFKAIPAGTSINALVTGATHYVAGANVAAVTPDSKITNTVVATTATVNNYYNLANSAGGASVGKRFIVNTAATAADIITSINIFATKGQFFAYTVDADGRYVLTAPKLADGTTALATLGSKIDNNVPLFDGSTNIGNSSTVFIYAIPSGDTVKYTVYTGIANAPKTLATTNATNHPGAQAIVKNSSGYATFVYVETASTTSTATDWVYFTSANYTTITISGSTYYLKDVILNGKADTVKVAAGDMSKVGMYNVTSVSDAGISTVAPVAAANSKVGIKGNSGSTLVTGDGTGYVYDSDTVVYYIDADNAVLEMTGDAIAKDATNLVYTHTTASGITDTIYVVEKNAEASALTIAVTGAGVGSDTDLYATGGVSITGATAATRIAVTTAADSYMSYTVRVVGNGTGSVAVTGSSASVGAAATATGYAYVATGTGVTADSTITITVTATDSFSETIDVYTYTVSISA